MSDKRTAKLITGISERLVLSQRDITAKEHKKAVSLERDLNSHFSGAFLVRCEDCDGTLSDCFSCQGAGKLVDRGVSHMVYMIELEMYNIDKFYGDYVTREVRKIAQEAKAVF